MRSSGAEPKKILYVGGFGLPDRTASAQRCLGVAVLLRSIGIDVVIAGKLAPHSPRNADETRAVIDGFRCYDIRVPVFGTTHETYVTSSEPIAAIMDLEGSKTFSAVMVYNYPARGFDALLEYCRPRGIPVIAECTEWYRWEGIHPLRNIRRVYEAWRRIRRLAPRAGNIVLASTWLAGSYPEANVIVLPFVVDARLPKWVPPLEKRPERRRFVYAGSPGIGLGKDHLHFAVAAFGDLIDDGVDGFEFHVVGLSESQYLDARPADRTVLDKLGDRIRFRGRVPHSAALAEIAAADFSVFFRPDNRVSRVGFPTKYVEAVCCGTPTITNRTSDLGKYLVDGVNGFLTESAGRSEITSALRRAVALDEEGISRMRAATRVPNPFHYESWQSAMLSFVQRLEVPA